MKECRLAKNAKNGMVKSASKMIGNNSKLSSFFLTKLKHTHRFFISWRKIRKKKTPKHVFFSIFAPKKRFLNNFIFTHLTKSCRKKN